MISIVPLNSTVTVSIAITRGSNPTCPGVVTTFTATPTNGGNAPFYQWKVNGINVGTHGSTYTTSGLINGQVVSCVLTSNIPCLAGAPATSNTITMVINPPADPTVTIAQTTGTTPICAADSATFTATVANGNNPSYHWKLDGNNAGANTNTFTGSGFTNGQTISCNITATATCPVTGTLGTGTIKNSIRSDTAAAYPTYYGNGRQQYLVLASELTALGLSAGNISSLGFTVAGTVGDPAVLNGYTIKLGQTSATGMTGAFQTAVFTTVFGPVNYTPILNSINTHFFSAPFNWDGTSNIIIDICFSNQVVGSVAYQSYQSPTAFVSNTFYQADNSAGVAACSHTTGPYSASIRPNMVFTGAAIKNATSGIITLSVTDGNTYTFTGTGNWNIASNWSNNSIPPTVLPSCARIFINPVPGGECILNVTQTIATGGKIIVLSNKKFRIPGNLIMQ